MTSRYYRATDHRYTCTYDYTGLSQLKLTLLTLVVIYLSLELQATVPVVNRTSQSLFSMHIHIAVLSGNQSELAMTATVGYPN